MKDSVKITSLQIRNYLCIEFLSLDNLGNFNIITGDNGTGKSTILTAIKTVYKGSGNDPDSIRDGADQAEIMVIQDDGMRIDRKIKQTGSTVKVVKGGLAITSPQKYLDSIFDGIMFNPVDFFLAKKSERRKLLLASIPMKVDKATLKKALGTAADRIPLDTLDYSKHALEVLDEIRTLVYGLRHEANLDVTRLTKALEQDRQDIPETFDAEVHKNFNLVEKTGQLTEAQRMIYDHEQDKGTLIAIGRDADQLSARIAEMERTLQDMEDDLRNNKVEQEILKGGISSFKVPDTETLQSEIAGYEEAQKLVHMIKLIGDREAELTDKTDGHNSLDNAYQQLTTAIPKMLLTKAKLPIEGLEIKGDDIFVEGVNIDKRSTSEQMGFALQMAKTSKSKVKAICVDRCESLGAAAFEVLRKTGPQGGYELFVTCVTGGKLNVSKEQ